MDEVLIQPMGEEDYDAVRALWMTIRGFGIRALDDSREDVTRFIRRNPTTSVVARTEEGSFLSACAFAGRDDMEITVNGNEDRILLTARFDNLGKGACGAAIQNMNLLTGADEFTGLVV